jgi:hypothetical protein
VVAFIQIESDNAAFSTIDTVRVMTGLQEGLLTVQSQHDTLKPYQRLIIQTDRQRYQTPTLAFDNICTAYSIQIRQTGLSIQEDYSFRLRRWAIEIIVVCILTFAIKGSLLFLVAAPHIVKIYIPFIIANGTFVIFFLILHYLRLDRPVRFGTVEMKFYYLTLLSTTLLECVWYYNLVTKSQGRIRIIAGTILGSLFWVFPGFLLILFTLFLFAHC